MAFPSIPSSSDSAETPTVFSGLQRFRRRHKALWLGLGICGTLLIFGLPVAKQRFSAVAEDAPGIEASAVEVLPVETLAIQPVAGYEVARAYTGEIAAQRSSDLGFERSGQLAEVLVEEGDLVTAGEPLARLDIRNLQTQRRQLEAEKARASAQLAELQAGPRVEVIAAAEAAVRDLEQQLLLQEAQYTRRESLYIQGAISAEELDQFNYDRNALQARLDQSRSNLAELQNGTRQEQIVAQVALVQQLDASLADLDVTIGKSTLLAPFDGIIATQSVDEGTVVGAGQLVIELVESVAPEARIGIPTATVSQLQVGTRKQVNLGEQTYPATVASVLPEVDVNTRTQTVIFQLESVSVASATPGQTARIELVERVPTDGFWLPTEALTQGIRGLWNCYVVTQAEGGDTYTVQQKAVEILHQTGDLVLVRGTLQPGDRIVANGTHRLVPGQQVQP
ncbi:MAG: efflux RND transporter periplasmic adaptor subunit [Leptolyngbya sp. SIO1D8]|nr:efflux RND transporter periplasmic adaptor subunit [Leptolyngbya sp. SIO1D8]